LWPEDFLQLQKAETYALLTTQAAQNDMVETVFFVSSFDQAYSLKT
jgi:hypothetical protein